MVCRGIFGILGFWLANFHSFGRRQQRSKYVLYSFGAEPRDNCADGIQDCSYHDEYTTANSRVPSAEHAFPLIQILPLVNAPHNGTQLCKDFSLQLCSRWKKSPV